MDAARSSPLLDIHRALGAKLTEFGGWEMPLQYRGIVAEHNAVRGAVGVFDVSHLGKLRVREGAALQEAVTADVMALEPGTARYALVLQDDGGCIDDVFVYRIDDDEWLVVPNAANVEAVAGALRECGADPSDEWDRWAILAIQGPASLEVFDRVFPGAAVTAMPLHTWAELEVVEAPAMVARTGYTGERGVELYVPSEVAPEAFRKLLAEDVAPVGLGARDTLRLEMGYALYGHELDRDTNPVEAGLSWAVAWDAPFRGREALLEVKQKGPRKRLFGIRCVDRGVPRRGYPVVRGEESVGVVVSGNFSPTLGVGIALAYAPAERRPEAGESVAVEARGRRIRGDIVKPPFVTRS